MIAWAAAQADAVLANPVAVAAVFVDFQPEVVAQLAMSTARSTATPSSCAPMSWGRIEMVEDRPGHDRRYTIDARLIQRALGWTPQVAFEEGLERTVRWHLDNEAWWRPLVAASQGLARLGRRQPA